MNKHAVNGRQQCDHFIYSKSVLSFLFFSIIERTVLMALFFLLQSYVRKGKNAKNPALLSFFFVTRRTQLIATHA